MGDLPLARTLTPAYSRKPQRAGVRAPSLALSLVGAQAHDDLPVRRTLRRWIGAALRRDAELTLVFVDARAGRRLNREYRGRDYATNVLTFTYGAAGAAVAPVVADIVLCLPVVRREAHQQGKTLRAHLAHLVIHGVLHAQGHDHERERDARRMQALETRLLAALRIADPYAAAP